MNKSLHFIVVSIAFMLLSSCLTSKMVVKVKPDGSGFVEEYLFVEQKYVQQMRMMTLAYAAQMKNAPGGKGGAFNPADFDIFDEKRLKDNAMSMGDGVTLASVEKINNDKGEGYKAIYSFKDINKLKLSFEPTKKINFDPTKKGTLKNSETITFSMTKGSPATLVVSTPPKKFGDASMGQSLGMGGGSGPEREMAMNMMRNIAKSMHVVMTLEPQGKILTSNATYLNKGVVTLMELDFSTLMADEKRFKRFQNARPKNKEEAKALILQTPGLKAELEDKISVRFR